MMHRQNVMGVHPMRDDSIPHVPANPAQNPNKQMVAIRDFIETYCNVSLDYDHIFIKKFEAISIVKDILKNPKVKPTNYMHSLVCDFTLIYQGITNDLLHKQIKVDFENAHLKLSRKEIYFNDNDEQALKELISLLYLEKDVAFDKDKVRYRNSDQRSAGGNNKKAVMKLYPLAEKSIKVLGELPSLLLIYFTTESSQNREPSTSFINLCDSILAFCTVYLSKDIKDKLDDVTINAVFSAQIRCLCFLGRVAEQTFKNYSNKIDLGKRFLCAFRNLFDNSLFEVLPDRIDIIQNMKVFFANKSFLKSMMKLLPELFYESHIVGCRYTERESLYNNGIRMQLDVLTSVSSHFNYELFNMACCHVIKQIHDVRCFNTNSNGYIIFIKRLVEIGLIIEEKEKKPVRKHFFELLECLVHKLGYIQDFVIPFAKTELAKLKNQGNSEYQPVNLQHVSNSFLKLEEPELKPTASPENHAKIDEISIDCLHQKYFNFQIIDIRIFVRSIVDSSYTIMKGLFETAQITESEGITNEHEIIEELFIRVLNCLEYIRLAKQYILTIQKIYTEQMQDEDIITVENFVSIFTMNIGDGFVEYLLKRNFNSILTNMMHERNIGHLILKFIDHEKTFFTVTSHIVKYLHKNISTLSTRSRDLVSLVVLQGFEKLFRPSSKVYTTIPPDKRHTQYELILSPHLLPIVKFAIENIFSVGDNNFYLSILKTVSRQTSDSILSEVVSSLLKDYFHTMYLVLLKLYNAEKLPGTREPVAETLSSFSCSYTNNAKCYSLWLIAMKAGWKQRNTSINSNSSHTHAIDFSSFKTSYLFNFDFQDGISFIEVMHDLMSPALTPSDNTKQALFAIREVARLGIMLLNNYWDDYPFSTSLNGTCEDVYLNIECQRNSETLKKAVEVAESMGILSSSERLLSSIRTNEPVVCQISIQSIVNVCGKLVKSYLSYNKTDEKGSKAPHMLFDKSLPYALVLCRKLVTVAIQVKDYPLPNLEAFSRMSKNALKVIREKFDKNDIKEIKKTMDAKVRFTFRNAIFVILSASVDKDKRKEDYKLMFVILKHLIYMALMEQLDDECEENNYLDSSLLGEGIALLTIDNTHSLSTITCGIFDKAISFVDTLLGAPKGYGYKLPLFTYTLSYSFECIRDGSTKTSKGCLELHNNVVRTAPIWYLMDKHKELINFYSYMLHHIDYDKIKEIRIGCDFGIFEIYERIFIKNPDMSIDNVVCKSLIDNSLDWCYSPIDKVQQLGFKIFKNLYNNLPFEKEALLKVCSEKFASILQEMNVGSACSSTQTQVSRYRALCEMLRLDDIWQKVGGFHCNDVSEAFNNIRLSFGIELEDLQIALMRHATAAEFPEIEEVHLSYAIALRTSQIKFLTVIFELVIIDEFKEGPKSVETISPCTKQLVTFIHDSIFQFDNISRGILEKELRKVKKVFQDRNICIDDIIDKKQMISNIQERFSKMSLLHEPHLDLYIAITSLYKSETIINDVTPIFLDMLRNITPSPGNLTLNNLLAIKKVLFIICDRERKSSSFVPVLLNLIAKLSASFYLDDRCQFEKDVIPLVNDHPEHFFSFFLVKEKVFDRTYYQLCKKFIYSEQSKPLKDYLQANPYIIEKLLDCQLLGEDGKTWEPVTFDNKYTRAEYDLFVFGVLLHALIKLKSWFGTQKDLVYKICNYFGSPQFAAEYSMRRNISSINQKCHQFKSIELPVYRVPEYAAKIMLLYYTNNLHDFKLLIKICGALDCGYLTNWTFVILFFREEIYPKMTVDWRRAAINYFVEQYENLIVNPLDWNGVGIFMLYIVAPSVIWHISRFDPKELILGVPNSSDNVIANVIQRCFTDKVDQHIIRPYTELSFIGIFIILRVALKANHELIHPASCTTKKDVSQFMYTCTNACYKIIKNNTKIDETVKGQSLYFLAHMVKNYSLHSVLVKPLFRQMLQTAHDDANPVALESMKLIVANLMPKKNPNIEIVLSTLDMLIASLPSDIIQTKHFTFGLRVISENYENFYLYRSRIFKHIMLAILKGSLFAKSPDVKKEFCDFMEIVGKWEDMRQTIANTNGALPERFDYDIPRGPKIDEDIGPFLLNIALNQIVRFPVHAATVNSPAPIHEVITKKCYALLKVLLQPQYFGKLFKLTNEIFDPIKKSLATIRNPASTSESKNNCMTLLSTCFEVLIHVIKAIPKNKVLDLLKQLQPYIIECLKISHAQCVSISYSLLHAICTLTKCQPDGIIELQELNNYLKDRMIRIADNTAKGPQRTDIKVTIGLLRILMEANDKYIETVCQKQITELFANFLKQLKILKQTHEQAKVASIEKSYMDMVEVFLEISCNRFIYWGQTEKSDLLSQVLHPLSEYLLKYPKLLVLYTRIAKTFLQTQGNETLGFRMISNIKVKIEYKILKSEALRIYLECINLIFNNEQLMADENYRQTRELIFLAAQYEDIVVSKNNCAHFIYSRMKPDIVSKFIHFFDHSCYYFTQNSQKIFKSFIQLFMYQGSINLEEVIEKIKSNSSDDVYNHTVLPNGSFVNIPSYYNLLKKTCFAVGNDTSSKMDITESFNNCVTFDTQEDISTPSSETQVNSITVDDYLANLHSFYSCLKGSNIQKEALSIIVLSGMNIECTSSMFRDVFVSAWKSLTYAERTLLEGYIDKYLKNFNQMMSSLSQIHTQIKFILQVLLECDPLPRISPDTLRYVMEYANNHHVVLIYLERLLSNAVDMPLSFNKQPVLFQLESNQLYNLELLDALSDVYNVLGDKDQVYALWNKRAYHSETPKALLSYAHGDYENCIKLTEKVLENYSQGKNFPFVTHLTPELSIEVNQQKTIWLESLKELGQWERIKDYASNEAVQDVFTLCESCFHLKNIEAVKDLLNQMAINIPFRKIASASLFESIVSALDAFDNVNPIEEDVKTNSDIIRGTKSKVSLSHSAFINSYRRLPPELTDVHLDMFERTTIYTDISEIVEWLSCVAQTSRNNQHVINDFRIRMNRWCNKVMAVPKSCKIKTFDLFTCWRKLMLTQINNAIKDKSEHHYYEPSFHKDINRYVVTILNHTVRSFANLLRDHHQYDRAIDELLTLYSPPETDGSIGLQTPMYLMRILNKKAKYYKTSPEEREKTLEAVIIHSFDCVENTISYNNLDILSRILLERGKAFSLQGKYHHAEESFVLALQSTQNSHHLGIVWLKMTRLFQKQLETTSKPSLDLCESAIISFMKALSSRNLWKNRKILIDLLWLLKQMSVLGEEYNVKAEEIIAKMLPTVTICTFGFVINDLVFELKERPSNAIKLILLNYARKFPQRTYYALRSHISEDDIRQLFNHFKDSTIFTDFISQAQSAEMFTDEIQCNLGENRARADINELIFSALQSKPTELLGLYHICKELSELSESPLEELIKYSYKTIDKCVKIVENSLKMNNKEGWVTSITNEVSNWKLYVLEKLKTDETQSEKRINKLISITQNMFTEIGAPFDNLKLYLTQIIDWVSVVVSFILEGGRSTQKPFIYDYVGHYNPKVCNIEIFSFALYGHLIQSDKNQEEVFRYTISEFLPYYKVAFRNGRIIKEFYVIGNSGKRFSYTIEKQDDIDIKNRISVFYKHLNYVMSKDPGTRSRNLQFSENRFIPIACNVCLFDSTILRQIPDEFSAIRVFSFYDTLEMSFDNRRKILQPIFTFIDKMSRKLPYTNDKASKIISEMVYGSSTKQPVLNLNMFTKFIEIKQVDANIYYLGRRRIARQYALTSLAEHILHMRPSTLKDICIDGTSMQLFSNNYEIDYHNKCAKYEQTFQNHIRLTPNIESYIHHSLEGHYYGTFIAFARCFGNRSMTKYLKLIFLDHLLKHSLRELSLFETVNETMQDLDNFFKDQAQIESEKSTLWDTITKAISLERAATISISDHPWY
uniref:FAT domain-containing protein n=1 Tax=Strongyloides papillosus TaxID=174720 RepID=A0A0N5BS16_STREA